MPALSLNAITKCYCALKTRFDELIIPVVPATSIAAATVTGDGNQPNSIHTLTSVRADAGWSLVGNAATFTGTPDHVEVAANLYYTDPLAATRVRVAPVTELLKNGVVVAKSATGYQRHGTQHISSSNTIAYLDPSPGSNPVYQLRAQQGSGMTDVVLTDIGTFSVKATT